MRAGRHTHKGLIFLLIMSVLPCAYAQTQPQTMQTDPERTVVAIRSNLLLPTLNVGAELPLGNRFSVGADWYYPWVFRGPLHKDCVQALGLSLEARCWLGSRHKGAKGEANRLLGHSVGIYTMGGIYDLERNYLGYQGEYWLAGVDYLYAMPLGKEKKWRLELSLGVGYFHSMATAYQVYSEGGKGYRDKDFRRQVRYYGPTKVAVSLVYPITCANKNKVKKERER